MNDKTRTSVAPPYHEADEDLRERVDVLQPGWSYRLPLPEGRYACEGTFWVEKGWLHVEPFGSEYFVLHPERA